MSERTEALQNPFSPEKAWVTFQENRERALMLKSKAEEARREGSAPEREMLLQAVEALGLLTDNTILLRVVRKALEARDVS